MHYTFLSKTYVYIVYTCCPMNQYAIKFIYTY